MSHHSVGATCQSADHAGCSGWVLSWDTPGQQACACCCHTGELRTARQQPLAAYTLLVTEVPELARTCR